MGPRWYCPPGVAMPADCPFPGGLPCLPEAGPPGLPPGGRTYGGAAGPGDWRPVDAHWIDYSGALPQHLVRLHSDPSILRWAEVPGLLPDQVWRVAVLLTPQASTYASALNRVWAGSGWHEPPHLRDIQRRLLHAAIGLTTSPEPHDASLPILVADILALGHCACDLPTLTAAGWMDELLAVRVCCAALDLSVA